MRRQTKKQLKNYLVVGGITLVVCLFVVVFFWSQFPPLKYNLAMVVDAVATSTAPLFPTYPPIDKADYDLRLDELANYPSTTPTTTVRLWPVKTEYPLPGAILPFKRIVAYYGNFYAKGMGVLGEYPEAQMLAKLDQEVKAWQAADPTTPVLPAIHYIAVTAQGSPGDAGKYRLRMPPDQIEHAIELADKIHGVTFIDIQVGLSNIQTEVELLGPYLKMPNVHLGVDPEFSMKTGKKPGTVIGTVDAADINRVTAYLAKLVQDNHLPPKILIIHRFTRPMVTNYKNIIIRPEVQIVMDMDGWGPKPMKLDSYYGYIYQEPVQFTGFKLFYKNDFRIAGSKMMTPAEVLKLRPKPSYIQYQ